MIVFIAQKNNLIIFLKPMARRLITEIKDL